MYNAIELIYYSSLVLDYNGLLFYWPISIVSWSSFQLMWCYPKSTPLKPPKPALPWIHVHNHQIQFFRSLPYDSKLLCSAGFGQVCFRWSDVAHDLYYRASRGVPHFSLNMVDCCFTIDSQSTEDWKTLFYALSLTDKTPSIAVYCCIFCWGTVQCQVTPRFTNQNRWKSWSAGQKQTPFPSPSDRNHSPMLVDCCVMCFQSTHALEVDVLPSEPPRISPPSHVTKK